MKPLVSVIIPAYNRSACLERALASVAGQTYPEVEIIVVDDGSKEDVASLVKIFAKGCKFPVTYIRQENAGPGIARKNGLVLSKGDLVQYLDSDDELLPEKLEEQVPLMESQPDAVMCYTSTTMVNQAGTESLRKFSNLPADDLLETALQYRRWHTSSCLWRYQDKRHAGWSALRNGEDVVHDVSVGVHYRKILCLPKALTRAHTGFEQLSASPTSPELRKLHARDICEVNLRSRALLAEHGLISVRKYSEPLAERFFYVGFQLALIGEQSLALESMHETSELTRASMRKLEAAVARVVITLVANRFRAPYRILFELHRRIWPEEVHCRRNIR